MSDSGFLQAQAYCQNLESEREERAKAETIEEGDEPVFFYCFSLKRIMKNINPKSH